MLTIFIINIETKEAAFELYMTNNTWKELTGVQKGNRRFPSQPQAVELFGTLLELLENPLQV